MFKSLFFPGFCRIFHAIKAETVHPGKKFFNYPSENNVLLKRDILCPEFFHQVFTGRNTCKNPAYVEYHVERIKSPSRDIHLVGFCDYGKENACNKPYK